MKTHLLFVAAAVIGLSVSGTFADIIRLKDGEQLAGDIKRSNDGWIVQSNGKQPVRVGDDKVDSIELTAGATTGPVAAADRLGSLRRSVENLTDLNQIVSRFQLFVDTITEPSATAEAKKDLAIWQNRLTQKMVKVGTQWVLPSARQKLLDQSTASAEQARQLLKQGRSKEAEPLLTDAITIYPRNAAALYLTGVLRYQQEQIPAARKSFEAVAGLMPNHGPTLNNLAVVQWRQRQYIPALSSFDAAMLASPIDRQILDNVASAMLALPVDLQKSPVTAKTMRHFQEQDQQLSQQMSQSGLHRYGAIWVPDRDMDQMRQQEKQTQDRLDILSGDFDRCKSRVDQLNQNISETQSQIHRIEANSIIGDLQNGMPVQVPYPQVYYDLTGDLKRMEQQRSGEVTMLDAIKKRADELQQNRTSQKFGGVQRIFGPEGTPMSDMPAPGILPR